MFFEQRLHEMSIEYKAKAREMRLKYRQTGNELYKILAEYYEDATDCDKCFQIAKKVNKKENLVAKKDVKDKRLWKCKSLTNWVRPQPQLIENYTPVRELTVDEAVSWHKDCVKLWEDQQKLMRQLKDKGICSVTVYDAGLFYKKDGEWVLYEENKENN